MEDVTLHVAAERLGVHYQTAYRWVRHGQLPAVKVAGVYRVALADVDALAQRRAEPSPPPLQRRVRDWAPYARRLFDHLVVGDELAVRELLEDLVSSGSTLAMVFDQVMVPALVRVGDAWMEGTLSIADEHRGSAILERIIGRLTPSPPGRPRGVALVCSPPGEQHQLPGQMATAVLREDHWRVHHLGIGVPVPDLLRMVSGENPSLLVISMTWPPARSHATDLAGRVEAPGRNVLIGGPGVTLDRLVTLARGGSVEGSVVAGSLVDGSVVAGSLVDGSVVAGSLVDGSVVAGSVADGSVVAGSVADGSAGEGSASEGSAGEGSASEGSAGEGEDRPASEMTA